MGVQERLYTATELLALPSDGKRYELIEGQLIDMAPTGAPHGLLSAEFAYLLRTFTREHDSGQVYGAETGFRLAENPDTVLGVDAAFISKARLKPDQKGYIEGAPDLAVEIASPGNTKTELHDKVKLYFQAGAQLVWIVYPHSRAIYVYTTPHDIKVLEQNETLTGDNVLPGFAVKVSEIFAVLDNK